MDLYPEEINNLSILAPQDYQIVKEFCHLLRKFVLDGKAINAKMYVSAAKKLNLQPSQVSAAVSALMSVLQRAAERQLSREVLAKLLSSTGLPEPSQEPVVQLYDDIKSVLLDCLQQQALQVPTLESLEWRVDVIAATRAAHGLAEPLVTLHLNTRSCPDGTTIASALGPVPLCSAANPPLVLQTDPATLRHVTEVLEFAVTQSRTPHHSRLSSALS